MARIKIEDLPKDMKISKNDMRKITGGSYIPNSQLVLDNISGQQSTLTGSVSSLNIANEVLGMTQSLLGDISASETGESVDNTKPDSSEATKSY